MRMGVIQIDPMVGAKMTPQMLTQAFLTGVFCAVFAIVVDAATEVLSMKQAIVLAMISGFLGSMFAQLVLKRTRK